MNITFAGLFPKSQRVFFFLFFIAQLCCTLPTPLSEFASVNRALGFGQVALDQLFIVLLNTLFCQFFTSRSLALHLPEVGGKLKCESTIVILVFFCGINKLLVLRGEKGIVFEVMIFFFSCKTITNVERILFPHFSLSSYSLCCYCELLARRKPSKIDVEIKFYRQIVLKLLYDVMQHVFHNCSC